MGPEVLPLGHLTRSTTFYRSCNCATHFTWESLPQGVRKGAWARKSCWEPLGWCLLLLSRVKQSLFHRHEDLQEPHEHNAAVRARCQCRNVPGGCTNTPDQSPQHWQVPRLSGHDRQPQNTFRSSRSMSQPQGEDHWHTLCDRSPCITIFCQFLIFFGIVFIYNGKNKVFLQARLHRKMLSKLTQKKTVNAQNSYSRIVLFKYILLLNPATTLVLHNTLFQSTEILSRRIILPIMMNWESGVNDASSVTALLLL